ncbi:hypothetical protein [Peribacillus sp. SCS-155]|uniref:hypothetical protein n=1 Tax=Peribacillus sedimenti TaxID=3115297 RepID=UPI0039065EBA
MLKKFISLIVIASFALSVQLLPMSAQAVTTTAVDTQIKNAVYANAKYLQEENVTKVMDGLYLTTDQQRQTKLIYIDLFRQYDLTYKITKFKIISTTKTTAKVSVTQITKKVKGPAFRNNQVVATHYLKLVKGKWKFTKSEIQSIKYLN